MHTEPPKKLLIINILDILKKYTDEDHRLSQKEVVDILKTEYNMSVDRKTVKRNLMNLIDFGYEIEYSESVRMVPNKLTGRWRKAIFYRTFIWFVTLPTVNCGCSSTVSRFPSILHTASARNSSVRLKGFPIDTSKQR